MNLTRIFSISLFIVFCGLSYYLYSSIKFKIDEEKRIAAIESKVIEKLKMIREAQLAYLSVHRQYTSDWDKLTSFIDTGKFYITQKSEIIIPRPHLPHLGDSVFIKIDTLGTRPVKDSIFKAEKYPNFNLTTLSVIPGSKGKKFELYADRIKKGGIDVDVFEAKDVAPVNPKRRANNNEKALRVGSRTDVSTSGNWE